MTQSFGNCAQYIQAREVGQPAASVSVLTERLGGVDMEARGLIEGADTFFVGSGAYGGLDMSHRGGRPGFVRVDGDVLTVPDFAGNRYFNTHGNFAVNPRAALLFAD
nr:pyridoxamine 5'-phosphate oxidase family protein [Pseudomonadota bacterium]